MPKCGGTSISNAMYATIPFYKRVAVIDAMSTRIACGLDFRQIKDQMICHEDYDNGQVVFDFRKNLLEMHAAWDTYLVHGHLFYSENIEKYYKDEYKYVTIMRDPLSRMISNYHFAKQMKETQIKFEDYIDSDLAVKHASVYLRYLTGKNNVNIIDRSEIELAKKRLEKFDLIGMLDDLSKFESDYRKLFGVKLNIPKMNVGKNKSNEKLSPDVERKFMELCSADYEIFEYAKEINQSRLIGS